MVTNKNRLLSSDLETFDDSMAHSGQHEVLTCLLKCIRSFTASYAGLQARQLLDEWVEDQVTKIDDNKCVSVNLP